MNGLVAGERDSMLEVLMIVKTQQPRLVFVVVAVAAAFFAGYAVRHDAQGLDWPTHVYTGKVIIVGGGTGDETSIGLDITSGRRDHGNGFAYPHGVVDSTVKVGQNVTLYTVEVPGDGERIVLIKP